MTTQAIYTLKREEYIEISELAPVSPVSHASRELLDHGYIKDDGELDGYRVLDLISQTMKLMQYEEKDVYSGSISCPDGERRQVLVFRNETGKYTVVM